MNSVTDLVHVQLAIKNAITEFGFDVKARVVPNNTNE